MHYKERPRGRFRVFAAAIVLGVVIATLAGAPVTITRLDLVTIAAVCLPIGAAGVAISRSVARQRMITHDRAVLQPRPWPIVTRAVPADVPVGAEPTITANVPTGPGDTTPSQSPGLDVDEVPRREPRPGRRRRPAVAVRRGPDLLRRRVRRRREPSE